MYMHMAMAVMRIAFNIVSCFYRTRALVVKPIPRNIVVNGSIPIGEVVWKTFSGGFAAHGCPLLAYILDRFRRACQKELTPK